MKRGYEQKEKKRYFNTNADTEENAKGSVGEQKEENGRKVLPEGMLRIKNDYHAGEFIMAMAISGII